MPELGPYGSVRGARGNSRPYRERSGVDCESAVLRFRTSWAHCSFDAMCQKETHAWRQTCLQSIIVSARSWNDGGIVRPNALAVQTLITNSNFVGCNIGKSAGLKPFRIRPA